MKSPEFCSIITLDNPASSSFKPRIELLLLGSPKKQAQLINATSNYRGILAAEKKHKPVIKICRCESPVPVNQRGNL